MLQSYYADMHIHIGRDKYYNPVKITASKSLTIENILKETSRRKGMQLIGVIDCQSPGVQDEIDDLLNDHKAYELKDGGIRFEQVTLLLGAEIELYDENCQGPIHVLCYIPSLKKMRQFTTWLQPHMKNVSLSSQRVYVSAKQLQYKVKELGGIFIPAHVFTPFKSVYGKGVKTSITEILDPDLIDAIELGLSADKHMADHIEELHKYTYVTNSDSHSLSKIGREYQKIKMKEPSFKEFLFALHQAEGRYIEANYGMNPQLGKYFTTVCQECFAPVAYGSEVCPYCQNKNIVNGVMDRIEALKNSDKKVESRPPYIYQVPLEYIKGLGPKTLQKIFDLGYTEMDIIHHLTEKELNELCKATIVSQILQMRNGNVQIDAGGGGKYGKLK